MRTTLALVVVALATSFAAACGDGPGSGVGVDGGADVGGADTATDTTDADVPDRPDTGDEPDVVADVRPDVADEDADTTPIPSRCPDDHCDVDGECIANGTVNEDNPCESCQAAVSRVGWSPNDAGSCDDGDLCTLDDRCEDGACVGTLKVCGAPDACLSGACDPDTGECLSAPAEGECNDGDQCTTGDVCVDGACLADGVRDCDDDNPCTDDTCDPAGGCVHTPLTEVACDDGNACTVGDICAEGVCIAGAGARSCDDGDLCTLDRCEPLAGCSHVSVADRCVDDNPCTDERCDPGLGCVFPFNTVACDDGDVCTVADVCTEGACRGDDLFVDDFNPCTDDVCVDPVGAAHVPNTDLCDDLDACTVGDRCADGGCVPGTTPLNCDDSNPCTDEVCESSVGCVRTNNTDACDDLDACTVADTCSDGACLGSPRNCDDGNACTEDTCDAATGCAHTLIISNACRPTITVDYPPRAATLLSSGQLVVRGHVESGAGSITSFTLNGSPVSLVDGDFSVPMSPPVGGNILSFEAEDSFGSSRRRVQSYVWAPGYDTPSVSSMNAGPVDPGLGYWLGQPTLDVLAGVFNLVIQNYNLGALLPNPVLESLGHTVRTRGSNPVTFGTPTTTLDARPAGMHVNARIPNLRAALTISGWACSGNVDYTATSLTVDADVQMTVAANHTLQTNLTNINATIAGGNLNFSCFLGGLISLIVGDVSGDFENAIESSLASALGPALGDAFNAFALDFDVPLPSLAGGDPIDLRLYSDWSSVGWTDSGARMRLRATSAPYAVVTPYTNLGSARRGGCGTTTQTLVIPGSAPLEVVLSDDLINQVLHAAWRGGLLEFDVPPELLGGVDLSAYGISDLTLVASGMLQPTASDCGRAPADGLGLHIGDLRIDADMRLFGVPVAMVIYVSLQARLELSASTDGIAIAVSDVEAVDLEVSVRDEAFLSVEPVVEQLLRENLVPSLTGLLGGDALGSFPLPEIDLSSSIAGLPAGTIIRIVPSRVLRSGGNSIVEGALVR
ncbi:MAG: hypothetical protein H6700_05265 [Myxococcales bacterium]|nr:hypothetical protein [Myxococcales bacterium]